MNHRPSVRPRANSFTSCCLPSHPVCALPRLAQPGWGQLLHPPWQRLLQVHSSFPGAKGGKCHRISSLRITVCFEYWLHRLEQLLGAKLPCAGTGLALMATWCHRAVAAQSSSLNLALLPLGAAWLLQPPSYNAGAGSLFHSLEPMGFCWLLLAALIFIWGSLLEP